MLVSTQTDMTAKKFGLVNSVKMIAEAGFDALDMSMFDNAENEWIFGNGFEKIISEAKKTAGDCGVFFNQAHAPFPTEKVNDEEYNKMIFPKVVRAIEVAGMLGVKNIVIHPVDFPNDKKQKNLEMYAKFQGYAEKANVKIALENMWGFDRRRGVICSNVCSTAKELAEYYDALPSDRFTVCLDLGHIGLVGEYEYDFIKYLGKERLTCLHVHDNDYVHDSHNAPFTMNLPWDNICKALAEIDYGGEITLEADNLLKHLPDELYADGLKFMCASAKYLAKTTDNLRG